MKSTTRFKKRKTAVVDFLCEVVAWILYGLSKVRLARKPWYTNCIAEFITCGYCMDRNGFPKFPLYRLAQKFEDDWKKQNQERDE